MQNKSNNNSPKGKMTRHADKVSNHALRNETVKIKEELTAALRENVALKDRQVMADRIMYKLLDDHKAEQNKLQEEIMQIKESSYSNAIHNFLSTFEKSADDFNRQLDIIFLNALNDINNPPSQDDFLLIMELKKLIQAIQPISKS